MTIEEAIKFAESGLSTGGQVTDEAFEALVKAARERSELLAALELVMSWIDDWDPDFIHDEDWICDSANIRFTIAKPNSKRSHGNHESA